MSRRALCIRTGSASARPEGRPRGEPAEPPVACAPGSEQGTGDESLTKARREPRPPICDEPLINALHANISRILLAVYALGLGYLSLLPFDFTGQRRVTIGLKWFEGLILSPSKMADILANIAMYMPLGALAAWCLRRDGWTRITSLLGAVTLGGTLSYLVERLQCHTISRVPSWVDVVANLLGTAFAALALLCFEPVVKGTISKMRATARANWWAGLSKAMVCAIILINLRPYDVAVNVKHALANTLRTVQSPGGLSCFAHWSDLRSRAVNSLDPLVRMQWEYIFERIGEFAMYAALAAMLVLAYESKIRGGGSRGRLGWDKHARIGIGILSLAAMITGIRCVLVSHGLDTMHMVCALAAWPIGTLCIRAGVFPRRNSAVAGIIAGMVAILAYDLVPFDWKLTDMARAAAQDGLSKSIEDAGFRLSLMPFAGHMRSPPNVAFSNMTGDLLRYGCLGIGATLLISRHRRLRVLHWRRQLLLCGVFGACCAIALESMHLIMPSRASDITTVMLAITGTCGGCIAMKWISSYRAAASVVVANDPLTSQLIEGATYSPVTIARPGSSHDDAYQSDLAESLLRG
jgi:glycopeptide antibiotics resistance protein